MITDIKPNIHPEYGLTILKEMDCGSFLLTILHHHLYYSYMLYSEKIILLYHVSLSCFILSLLLYCIILCSGLRFWARGVPPQETFWQERLNRSQATRRSQRGVPFIRVFSSVFFQLRPPLEPQRARLIRR